MTAPLVAFGGHAGAGKDLAGRCLIERGYTRLAFADSLKDLALALNPRLRRPSVIGTSGCTLAYECARLADLGIDAAKKWDEGRRFLQDLGENTRNLVDPDVWIRAVENKMINARFGEDEGGVYVESVISPTVITDLRYPNEERMVRKYGGLFIWLTRPGVGPCNDHESERDLSHLADVVIENDGTVEELWEKVLEVVNG